MRSNHIPERIAKPAPKKSGRPALFDKRMPPKNVTLPPELAVLAEKLGGGKNASEGIRRALRFVAMQDLNDVAKALGIPVSWLKESASEENAA